MEERKERRLPERRKARLVHARIQGVPALLFALLVAAAAALFALAFLHGARPLLREACTKGHYCPTFSAGEVVGDLLLRQVAVLGSSLLLCGALLLVLLSARVTAGIRAVCETLRRSALGDLSTPTGPVAAPGPEELARVLDRGARRRTLERIVAARTEAESLAGAPPEAGELERRLAALARALREVAP